VLRIQSDSYQDGSSRGERAIANSDLLTPEERERITEIQDLLIDRYVEQKEMLEEGNETRSVEIDLEIKKLKRELEKVKEWANV